MSNPFASPSSQPGHGIIHLALLPPSTPRLRTVKYQYPLKLVAPAPLRTEGEPSAVIHTVYLLSYGGGIVAGDTIDLRIVLDPSTRLVLLTQGSTKLFKAPSRDVLSTQTVTVDLFPGSSSGSSSGSGSGNDGGAGLCYLPDPVQPFGQSCFAQHQVYNIHMPASAAAPAASLCVLDWVSSGRAANGEHWSFHRYASRNEVFLASRDDDDGAARKLLLRDNLVLDDAAGPVAAPAAPTDAVARRMDGLAVYGTLIVYGPLFRALGEFFMEEFRLLPRMGGRKWDAGSDSGEDEAEAEADPAAVRRVARQRREAVGGVLWSAASVRGCVVVKLGAPELEHARRWLFDMLSEEGSVRTHFGERALLCLR